jgi:hypothetical protein
MDENVPPNVVLCHYLFQQIPQQRKIEKLILVTVLVLIPLFAQ